MIDLAVCSAACAGFGVAFLVSLCVFLAILFNEPPILEYMGGFSASTPDIGGLAPAAAFLATRVFPRGITRKLRGPTGPGRARSAATIASGPKTARTGPLILGYPVSETGVLTARRWNRRGTGVIKTLSAPFMGSLPVIALWFASCNRLQTPSSTIALAALTAIYLTFSTALLRGIPRPGTWCFASEKMVWGQ